MKHNQLLSVAHNLADSFASGCGFLVGHWSTDIYREVVSSSEGHMTIDFLAGEITGGNPSENLAAAVKAHRDALPKFCWKNRVSVLEFTELTVRYSGTSLFKGSVTVTIVDRSGRRSVAEYAGYPLRRGLVMDGLGRPRRRKRRN